MQIDNPERGFTFKQDGPLDLRLDPTSGEPASQRLRELNREEIAAMLVENADEPYAQEIAKAIFQKRRKRQIIETTRQLADTVEEALSFLPQRERKEAVKKSCQRTFQALRIDVNSEFEVLYSFLEKLPSVLKPGGKVAVLTFHSGEDRLVKKSFQALARQGCLSRGSQRGCSPFCAGMFSESPGKVDKNAMGNSRRRLTDEKPAVCRSRMLLQTRLGCILHKVKPSSLSLLKSGE